MRLAFRSKQGAEEPHIKGELTTYNERFWEYCRDQPDHIEGQMNSSHKTAFDATYPRPFPMWIECGSIHDACVELAIVYFCQILNIGYSDTGAAAKNDKLFRDQHLTAIAQNVFDTSAELDRFDALCEDLQCARNQMIGHADASAFEIEHGTPISKMKMYRQAWQHLDLQYWYDFLEPLRLAILQYSQDNT